MRAGNRLGLSSHSFPAERLLKSLRKSRFQRLLKAAYKHKWCIQTHGRKKETQSPTTYALQLVAWHSPHLTGPIDEILQDVLVAKSHGGRLISKKKGDLVGKTNTSQGWQYIAQLFFGWWSVFCTISFSGSEQRPLTIMCSVWVEHTTRKAEVESRYTPEPNSLKQNQDRLDNKNAHSVLYDSS